MDEEPHLFRKPGLGQNIGGELAVNKADMSGKDMVGEKCLEKTAVSPVRHGISPAESSSVLRKVMVVNEYNEPRTAAKLVPGPCKNEPDALTSRCETVGVVAQYSKPANTSGVEIKSESEVDSFQYSSVDKPKLLDTSTTDKPSGLSSTVGDVPTTISVGKIDSDRIKENPQVGTSAVKAEVQDEKDEIEFIACVQGTSGQSAPKKPKLTPTKKKAVAGQKVMERALGDDSDDDFCPEGDASLKKKAARKRRSRDMNAPPPPLTGYVRFLNSRRDKLRAENPSMPLQDIVKKLAQEWMQLTPDEKRPYLDEAIEDRKRYTLEMEEYKKTDTYKEYIKQQQQDRQKERQEVRKAAATAAKLKQKEDLKQKSQKKSREQSKPLLDGMDIPIFTEEFLEHNRACEAELRQLRRLTTDYEQQNAALSQIVCNMRNAVHGLEAETAIRKANNEIMQKHLTKVRGQLATALKDIPLPGSNYCPTEDTIDDYMEKMRNHLEGPETPENKALHNKVVSILERLDLG